MFSNTNHTHTAAGEAGQSKLKSKSHEPPNQAKSGTAVAGNVDAGGKKLKPPAKKLPTKKEQFVVLFKKGQAEYNAKQYSNALNIWNTALYQTCRSEIKLDAGDREKAKHPTSKECATSSLVAKQVL